MRRPTVTALKALLAAIAAAVCFLFADAVRAQELIAEIPYRYAYNGWITLPVSVNGEGPYDFIVDTGATLSVVFSNMEETQSFPYLDEEPRRILGLIEASDLPARYIGNLDIAGQKLTNLTSVVIPNWKAPLETPQGVLGLDFLAQYVVSIDPALGIIRLYDKAPSTLISGDEWTRASLKPRVFNPDTRPLYIVKARIRNRSYPFIFDLGAAGTLVNYPALRNMLTTRRVTVRSSGSASRRPKVQDLFGNETRSRLIRLQRIKMGNVTWRNKIISVYNSDVFDELGVGDEPFGLFGADMIRDRQIVIDFKRNRLHIGPQVEQTGPATN